MPRYFFTAEGDGHFSEDEEGEHLPDDAAAREAAEQTAKDLVASSLKAFFVVVRDESGQELFRVPIDVSNNEA